MRSKFRVPSSAVCEELSIQFVNTVAWRLRDPVDDRVRSAAALLGWLKAAGVADARLIIRLRAHFEKYPREERAFQSDAVRLREAIYQILLSRIDGKSFDRSALKTLNSALQAPARGLHLATSRRALSWHAGDRVAAPNDLLKPIAWSAAGLLTGPRCKKLRQCQDERGCGWLFIDESRAQNRRWCSMGDCGNRAKVLRHYHRHAG
jgi:predicted RNA-binding Zn ribbon-like protein